jgi:hypothetical protein
MRRVGVIVALELAGWFALALEVIYYRNRVLWRIGLDGSNNAPLFGPPHAPATP